MHRFNIFNYLPHQAKGRWFAFEVSSDGSDHSIDKGDIDAVEISGNFLKLTAPFHIIDMKYDIQFVPDAAADTMDLCIKNYADGTQAVPLPKPAKYQKATVWVFANYVPLS